MKYNKDIVVKWFAEHGLEAWPEYRFDVSRRWRFDFLLRVSNRGFSQGTHWDVVALEVEGGVFTGGRHTRGSGFVKDMEKYNAAAALGYRVLRVMPDQLCMQETIDLIKRALNA